MLPLSVPRSAPEIVDIAVNLVRRHYPTFLTVSAVAFAPMLLLTPVSETLPQIAMSIAGLICGGFAEACLLIGVAAVYRGEALPGADVQLRAGSRIAGRVIRIAFVRNVATALGLILLIVPGLLAYAHYALGTPVAAIEELKAGAAINRGAALAKGEKRRIILVGGLTAIIFMLLWFGAAMVAALVTRSEAMAYLAGTVVEILLMPMVVAITVLLYYDIRQRREGLDIEMALGQVGAGPIGGQ
jgi:hypothetical protein